MSEETKINKSKRFVINVKCDSASTFNIDYGDLQDTKPLKSLSNVMQLNLLSTTVSHSLTLSHLRVSLMSCKPNFLCPFLFMFFSHEICSSVCLWPQLRDAIITNPLMSHQLVTWKSFISPLTVFHQSSDSPSSVNNVHFQHWYVLLLLNSITHSEPNKTSSPSRSILKSQSSALPLNPLHRKERNVLLNLFSKKALILHITGWGEMAISFWDRGKRVGKGYLGAA